MYRPFAALVVIVFCSHVGAANANAQICCKYYQYRHTCCKSACRSFWKNNAWPQPYTCYGQPDKMSVYETFAQCTVSGWQMQNTMSDYHFNPETGALNDTGNVKLEWLAFETPEQYRQVFVLRAHKPEQTDARVKSVQAALDELAPAAPIPILVTTERPIHTPATYLDHVGRSFIETLPPPQLPASTTGGAGDR